MLKALMKRIAAVALSAVIVQGLFLPALAQSDEVSGSRAASHQMQGVGYTAKLYNASNGLPTSDANAVLSSSDGFIWIGSNSGLIRYDGTAFERQEDFKDITGVNVLLEDDNGRCGSALTTTALYICKTASRPTSRLMRGLLLYLSAHLPRTTAAGCLLAQSRGFSMLMRI
ncbi:MAG: hypothetical protein K6F91_07655 [Ruminococcus sp.]|nr:hypothetical protein [Ruminococcus sp.]